MIKEGYVTEQAIVARKHQLDNVLSKLNLIFDFYKENKRLPESNKDDKEEMKLYDFLRHLDISKYINDIDPEIINKLDILKKKQEKIKIIRKEQKKIKNKQNYITKCVNNYYNFYLNNGYFASDCSTRLEKSIAKDYYGIMKFESMFTKEHRYYINIINDIKMHNNKMQKLLRIKRFIKFCKTYDRFPTHYDGDLTDKTDIDRYEATLLDNITNKFDLDSIEIPYWLINELNDTINNINEKEFNRWQMELNTTMSQIIYFIREKGVSADSKKYYDYEIIGFNGNKEKVSSALKYVKDNINYVDKHLIDTYNRFAFVRKPLNNKYYSYYLVGYKKGDYKHVMFTDNKPNNKYIFYKKKK